MSLRYIASNHKGNAQNLVAVLSPFRVDDMNNQQATRAYILSNLEQI